MKINELLEGLKDRFISNMEVEVDKDGDISMLIINFEMINVLPSNESETLPEAKRKEDINAIYKVQYDENTDEGSYSYLSCDPNDESKLQYVKNGIPISEEINTESLGDGFAELTRKLSQLTTSLKDSLGEEDDEEDPTVAGFSLLKNSTRRHLEELNKRGEECVKYINESDEIPSVTSLLEFFSDYLDRHKGE